MGLPTSVATLLLLGGNYIHVEHYVALKDMCSSNLAML